MLPKKHIDIGKSRNALSSINFGIPTIFAYRLAKKKRAGISKLVDEEAVPPHKPKKVTLIVFLVYIRFFLHHIEDIAKAFVPRRDNLVLSMKISFFTYPK